MEEYNAMGRLINLNNLENKDLLNDLFDSEIIVVEDIQASKIWANWNGECFVVKAKSLNTDPINMIDLAMQNYYNAAIDYLNSLDDRVKSLINKKWWFCFEYFPDQFPGNIEYSRIPKNKLVLSSIYKANKYEFKIDEIDEYARLFNVDMIPVVFQGKLSEKMIEAIKYFINTSEEDLEYVFGEKSFAFFFYKMLNPNSTGSFLMDGEYQENIEKLVIHTNNGDISFELLNPLYKRISEENSTEFVEIYTLILVNFLNFCQSLNIDEIKLKGGKKDETYIFLICKLYNLYVGEVKQDLINFDFVIPEFYDKDKFKINTELIENKLTKEYIAESEKLEYIFKCILSSFSKKRKKPIGLFTDNTVALFNRFVDSINSHIERYLNKIHEVELIRTGLIDFSDFLDFKSNIEVDGQGNVYPDVYDELEREGESKKKGKGKSPAPEVKENPKT